MDNGPIAWERSSGDMLELAEHRAQQADLDVAMAAMVFSEDQQPDEILSEFAARLMDRGHRVMGLVQKGHCNGPATRELFATLLHTGDDVQLFQDLGSCAQGCKLDVNQLLRAGASISEALEKDGADVLVINRFGKLEKEGKGLLFLIEQALSAEIPVLIAVPEASMPYWMEFSGGLGVTLACSKNTLTAWWKRFASPKAAPHYRRSA
ncbi:MAG TPA: DUF2478 domain-containing protein [Afipia sp.]